MLDFGMLHNALWSSYMSFCQFSDSKNVLYKIAALYLTAASAQVLIAEIRFQEWSLDLSTSLASSGMYPQS